MSTDLYWALAGCGGGQQLCVVTVDVAPPGGGTVQGGGTLPCEYYHTLTAMPAQGQRFSRWLKNGIEFSANNPLRILPRYGETHGYTAVFVSATGTGTPPPAVTPDPTPVPGDYPPGQTWVYVDCVHCKSRLQARKDPGPALFSTLACPKCGRNNTFWGVRYGALRLSGVQTVTVEITVRADPPEGGSVAGGGVFAYGNTMTVRATPRVGYSFDGWYDNGRRVSDSLAFTFEVTGAHRMVAKFVERAPQPNVEEPAADDPGSGGGTTPRPPVIPQPPIIEGMSGATIAVLAAAGVLLIGGGAVWLLRRKKR